MPKDPRSVRYLFGPFTLLPAERQLLRDSKPVPLGPRAFDVLLTLVEYNGKLAAKEILLERVWPNLIVENNTIQAVISTLRKILGADAISTVSKFGYRLNLSASIEEVTASSEAHHFPTFQSSFIGRKDKVAAVAELLSRSRIVTIHGPGGAGKTRLAVETALSQLNRFDDGGWFVDLTPLQDAASLARRVASVLGIRVASAGDPTYEGLLAHLAHQKVLLVLDNAEHMVTATAALVDALLSSCPHVVVLVTSRQPIGALGESVYRIPSLSLPDLDRLDADAAILESESAILFIERARLQKQHFAPQAEAARCVARICRRLEGMPLSIELAASRVRSMAVEEIDQRLDDALRLLVSQPSDAPRRHRTLRALIEWGYDLLSQQEKKVFRRVSVFSGGFTLDMAEGIFDGSDIPAWSVLELVEGLIDKSMLVADGAGPACRYRQLETLRQYAAEQLAGAGESGPWARLHLEYFLKRVIAADVAHSTDADVLAAAARDEDNINAALTSALVDAPSAALGLKLSVRLYMFWYHRGLLLSSRDRFVALLAKQLVVSDEDRLLRLQALNAVSVFCRVLRDDVLACSAAEESLSIAREQRDAGAVLTALHNLAGLYLTRNDVLRAARGVQDELHLLASFASFDASAAFEALGCTADVSFPESLRRDEIDAMSKTLTDTLTLPDANRKLAIVLVSLAMILFLQARVIDAEQVCKQAMAAAERSGDQATVALARSRLAGILERGGQVDSSIPLYLSSLDFFVGANQTLHVCATLDALAHAFVASGRHELAARTLGSVSRLSSEANIPPSSFRGILKDEGPPENPAHQRASLAALGEKRFEASFQTGYETDLTEFLSELAKYRLTGPS